MPALLPAKEHLKTTLEDYFCVEHGDKPEIELSSNVVTINCCCPSFYADCVELARELAQMLNITDLVIN
ncbi:MAG TPA: hypothetical protein VHE59_07110 [Mucilaginibacter sp.]|nr:hypothetical protein [Mucilaginibacter sp.]